MEARKITVISSSTTMRRDITSEATTLQELKRDLDANGIDYSGQTFMVAVAKVELKDDSALLPTNLPTRDGGTTNNLVIMLTAEQKKVKSGAYTYSEAKAMCKADKQLAEFVKAKSGKNYTICPGAELIKLVTAYSNTAKKEVPSKPASSPAKPEVETPADTAEDAGEGCKACVGIIENTKKYVDELHRNHNISDEVYEAIKAVLDGEKPEPIASTMSDAEAHALFADWVGK